MSAIASHFGVPSINLILSTFNLTLPSTLTWLTVTQVMSAVASHFGVPNTWGPNVQLPQGM